MDVIARRDAPLADASLRDAAGEPLFPDIDWDGLPWQQHDNQPAWQRPEASWRRMLLQQPPVKKLLLVMDEKLDISRPSWSIHVYHGPHYAAQHGGDCETRSEPCEDGLRMGRALPAIGSDRVAEHPHDEATLAHVLVDAGVSQIEGNRLGEIEQGQ